MDLRLLFAFANLFAGKRYEHRRSHQGDAVATEFYEDLLTLAGFPKLQRAVTERVRGLGPRNKTVTLKRMRRGDGTFGLLVDPASAHSVPGFGVARGAVATIDIAVEVKVLNKAMGKQVDRVISDLRNQARQWSAGRRDSRPIKIAVVGINHADYTVSYEGPDRAYRTDGSRYAHPADEAEAVERRVRQDVVESRLFDDVVVLRYRARNDPPFAFEWVNPHATEQAYRAVLLRVAVAMEGRL